MPEKGGGPTPRPSVAFWKRVWIQQGKKPGDENGNLQLEPGQRALTDQDQSV